jgi:hypothetical protein
LRRTMRQIPASMGKFRCQVGVARLLPVGKTDDRIAHDLGACVRSSRGRRARSASSQTGSAKHRDGVSARAYRSGNRDPDGGESRVGFLTTDGDGRQEERTMDGESLAALKLPSKSSGAGSGTCERRFPRIFCSGHALQWAARMGCSGSGDEGGLVDASGVRAASVGLQLWRKKPAKAPRNKVPVCLSRFLARLAVHSSRIG